MTTTKITSIAIVVVVLTTIATIPSVIAASYSNSRITVQYPEGWNISAGSPDDYTIFNHNNLTSHRVIGISIGWNPAPSWVLDKDAWIAKITKMGNIVNTISNDTTLSNHTALLITYTDNDFRNTAVTTVINGTEYTIAYGAPDSEYSTYLNQINAVLNSFHVNYSPKNNDTFSCIRGVDNSC